MHRHQRPADPLALGHTPNSTSGQRRPQRGSTLTLLTELTSAKRWTRSTAAQEPSSVGSVHQASSLPSNGAGAEDTTGSAAHKRGQSSEVIHRSGGQGSYPNGSPNQPWITRIDPRCGQLKWARPSPVSSKRETFKRTRSPPLLGGGCGIEPLCSPNGTRVQTPADTGPDVDLSVNSHYRFDLHFGT
jgi:hypothetical protein